MEIYTAIGLRFDSLEGRIREAVYYGLKKEGDKEKKEIVYIESFKEESEELSTTISTNGVANSDSS